MFATSLGAEPIAARATPLKLQGVKRIHIAKDDTCTLAPASPKLTLIQNPRMHPVVRQEFDPLRGLKGKRSAGVLKSPR